MLRFTSFCLAIAVLPAVAWGQNRQGIEFFESKIRPVLVKHCYECHAEDSKDIGGELLLDSRAGIRRGGESGAAVTPGSPAKSLILSALAYNEFEMPPEGKLPDTVLADFRRWIKMGAPDPRAGGARSKVAAKDEKPAGKLWSLQPLSHSPAPAAKQQGWVESDIDRYVLAKLEAAGIQPLEDATPLAFLRRLTFDLTGLPPTVEQIEAFEKDHSQQAIAALVDKLLASPQYAERWARHWLDIARFAESNGKDRDVLMPHAWRYRNYVIDAFEKDVPYDQFVTEQIAGDLLPASSPAERDRLNIATGFLAVGSKSFTSSFQMDLVDDQIDVVSRSVLGLTVSCARCHDHKYDPVPTRDYYAMAGIFRSTETRFGGGLKRGKNAAALAKQLIALESVKPAKASSNDTKKPGSESDATESNQRIKELTQQRVALNKRVRMLTSMLPADWRKLRQPLTQKKDRTPAEQKQLEQIQTLMKAQQDTRDLLAQIRKLQAAGKKGGKQKKGDNPAPAGAFAVGVMEGPKPADCRIHIRGDAKTQGDSIPRGFLSCINVEGPEGIDSKSSGRRELAAWLTHPDNPLTPRVMANRVWLHLMGEGLVATPDNFGVNAVEPTHPELLDFLAREFQSDGWSVKQLIRKIVLSHTYRVAARQDAARSEIDPENKLLWRHPRRRLEAECIRDAILAASGQLELERPKASPVAQIGEGEVGRGINTAPLSAPFPHRSVYLPVIRGIVPPILKTFDFPEPSNVQGRRDVTTVPSQSLFLMNNQFVVQQAKEFAGRVLDASKEDNARVQLAFKSALSRPATQQEMDAAVSYVKGVQKAGGLDETAAWASFCQALFASAEFRYTQ